MVELAGNSESYGIISHGFNNWIFIGPGIITFSLIGFFVYKLVQNLKEKEKRREEKKMKKMKKTTKKVA
ncbi:uncharacterized protein LOC142645539 [Dermatophagoides pteronyssinus]|uniref:uncharacterized protein LOC142645539 n=1 Tax=Dermatophagoides pteronyssinus TaxID=6956 RepID=UPI003F67120A